MKGHIHLHTKASDGKIEPEHIIEAGHDFVAITDHDTFGSIERFKVLEEHGIEVIPGIELSARHMGKNIHMLVYYPKYDPEIVERQILKEKNEKESLKNQMYELQTKLSNKESEIKSLRENMAELATSTIYLPEIKGLPSSVKPNYREVSKVFSNISADSAVDIMSNLTDEEIIGIISLMEEKKVAELLSAFEPVKAAELSRMLAEKSGNSGSSEF